MEKIAQQTIYLLNIFEDNSDEKIAGILVSVMGICEFRCNQYLIIEYLLSILEKTNFNKAKSNSIIKILSQLKITYWSEELGKIFRLIKSNVSPIEFLKLKDVFIINNQHFGVNVMEV